MNGGSTKMRKLALLLLLAGLALVVLRPWLQTGFSGNEIASFNLFERKGEGWKSAAVTLSPSDNPFRLRINASFVVDAKTRPVKLPLKVRISGADGVVLDGTVSLKTDLQGAAPEGQKVKSITAPVFAIVNGGEYLIEVGVDADAPNYDLQDPGLSAVNANIAGNVTEADDGYLLPGVVMIVLGISFLARKRRKRPAGTEQAVNQTGPARKKRKSRWGRQGHSR